MRCRPVNRALLYAAVPVTAVDLFAGAGGWDIAQPNINPLGIEIDEWACKTRDAAGLATFRGDVTRIDPIPCDLLIASPPCQGFSMAGKRDPNDPRNALVWEPLAWAQIVQPTYIALEQVPPVLPIWEQYAARLRELGYEVWTGLLHAEQFGVPQTRKRAILMARRDGKPCLPPQPTHSRYYARDPARLDDGVLPWGSMAEALGWSGADAPAPTLALSGSTNPIGGSGSRAAWAVRTRGDRKTSGGNLFDASTPARALTEKARSWTRERPATTVAGEPRLGGVGDYRERHRQDGGVRITLAEAAILQSFPPDYPFQGVKSRQFLQVGNAVPPRLARAILGALVA